MAWAFTQGVYMSGNTPSGVINFLRNKLSSSKTAGKPADDESPGPQRLYLVIFVSQPQVLKNLMNGPIDAVIIKATSPSAAFAKAPIAVGAYMTTYYAQPGLVGFFQTPVDELPVDYAAGITSIHDFGTADGIGSGTEIRSSIPILKSQISVLKTCNGGSWSALETADTDPNALVGSSAETPGIDNQWVSIAWRRDVMGNYFPPAECLSYSETIGDIFSQTTSYYQTDIKNNMTMF